MLFKKGKCYTDYTDVGCIEFNTNGDYFVTSSLHGGMIRIFKSNDGLCKGMLQDYNSGTKILKILSG